MQEIFQFSVKIFVSEGSGTEVTGKSSHHRGHRGSTEDLLLPISAVYPPRDSVAQVQDVEVNQEADVPPAEPHV